MKRGLYALIAILVGILLLLPGCGGGGQGMISSTSQIQPGEPEEDEVPNNSWEKENQYAPARVLVKFKEKTDPAKAAEIASRLGIRAKSLQYFPFINVHLLEVSPERAGEDAVTSAILKLMRDPEVEYAEPDYIVKAKATPNDPGFGVEWGLHNTGQTIEGQTGIPDADIDAQEAWDLTTGGNVNVGDIDTGVE